MNEWHVYSHMKNNFVLTGQVMTYDQIKRVFPQFPRRTIKEGIAEFNSVKDELYTYYTQ